MWVLLSQGYGGGEWHWCEHGLLCSSKSEHSITLYCNSTAYDFRVVTQMTRNFPIAKGPICPVCYKHRQFKEDER